MNDLTKSWLYVCVQASLFLLLIVYPNQSMHLHWTFFAMSAVLGLSGALILLMSIFDLRKSLTVFPKPKESGRLQVHGLYRYIRHPMYLGVLLVACSIALVSGSLVKYLLVLALYILFSSKAHYEEKLLLKRYPEYEEYMKNTKRFTPSFKKH